MPWRSGTPCGERPSGPSSGSRHRHKRSPWRAPPSTTSATAIWSIRTRDLMPLICGSSSGRSFHPCRHPSSTAWPKWLHGSGGQHLSLVSPLEGFGHSPVVVGNKCSHLVDQLLDGGE